MWVGAVLIQVLLGIAGITTDEFRSGEANLTDIQNMATNAWPFFDKIAFDLDVIGRQREIASIEEKERTEYAKAGTKVNIAIWNMHVPVDRHFDGIIKTDKVPMGRGGGFVVVVFRGAGHIQNKGALGLDNWRCSGNVAQHGTEARFKARGYFR